MAVARLRALDAVVAMMLAPKTLRERLDAEWNSLGCKFPNRLCCWKQTSGSVAHGYWSGISKPYYFRGRMMSPKKKVILSKRVRKRKLFS